MPLGSGSSKEDDPCGGCHNQGTCVPSATSDLGYRCACDFGFSGQHCEHSASSSSDVSAVTCDSSPCHPGVQCFPLGPSNRACGACPQGMTGDGVSCHPVVVLPSNIIETVPPHLHLNQSINLCLNDATNPCFDKSYCREELEKG